MYTYLYVYIYNKWIKPKQFTTRQERQALSRSSIPARRRSGFMARIRKSPGHLVFFRFFPMLIISHRIHVCYIW